MSDGVKDFSSQNEAAFNLKDSNALTDISGEYQAPFFLHLCTQEMQQSTNDDHGCNSVNTGRKISKALEFIHKILKYNLVFVVGVV